MLAARGRVAYLNEPLNPVHPPGGFPGVLNLNVRHRFEYICDANGDRYLTAFEDMKRFRYHPLAELQCNPRIRDVPRQLNHIRRFAGGRLGGHRLLVGDPYAVFSLPWLTERIGFEGIVLVRRPAATVSSRKRLGWFFDPEELREQTLLVQNVLEPLGIRTAMGGEIDPIVEAGALLWAAIYRTVAWYRETGVSFHVVRHEDLSHDPVGEFARLYERLGMCVTKRASQSIARASSAQNPDQAPQDDPHSIRVNSRATLESWRGRLSTAEIARLAEITTAAALEFYAEPEIELHAASDT